MLYNLGNRVVEQHKHFVNLYEIEWRANMFGIFITTIGYKILPGVNQLGLALTTHPSNIKVKKG